MAWQRRRAQSRRRTAKPRQSQWLLHQNDDKLGNKLQRWAHFTVCACLRPAASTHSRAHKAMCQSNKVRARRKHGETRISPFSGGSDFSLHLPSARLWLEWVVPGRGCVLAFPPALSLLVICIAHSLTWARANCSSTCIKYKHTRAFLGDFFFPLQKYQRHLIYWCYCQHYLQALVSTSPPPPDTFCRCCSHAGGSRRLMRSFRVYPWRWNVRKTRVKEA